jgi:5-methylcytosine-specific restriction endonuclease McrA
MHLLARFFSENRLFRVAKSKPRSLRMVAVKRLDRLINILGISEDEAMRALISSFASVQPGPMRQKLLARKDYGSAPTTSEIWGLLDAADFRCVLCHSHADLTLDHINRDCSDGRSENLRVLCNSCNRSTNSRPVTNKNMNLKVYESIIALVDALGRFPNTIEVQRHCGISNLGPAYYLIRFFERKWGCRTPLRPYRR